MQTSLPIAIIGSGPVGLAAAAHLAAKDETFVLIEAGDSVADSVRSWGHVRVFSPWRFNIDPVAAGLLAAVDWEAPNPDGYPTGNELIEGYLEPLAAHPAIAPHIRLGATVQSISRLGLDKLTSSGREDFPFVITVRTADGAEKTVLARAVIDASGTYRSPNPLGSSGVPAPGEKAASANMFYGIPDVLGRDRQRYAGKRVLVVGSGHSAFNALNDLAGLTDEGTTIAWAVRSGMPDGQYGGGTSDQLPKRGELGTRIKRLVDRGGLELQTGFRATSVQQTPDGVVVASGDRALAPVDEVIVVTGFRPDHQITTELRLSFDEIVESPTALAPLIDPNLHSCGTVPPHGAAHLGHPEPGYYAAGMKSYGRAPTFLMMTGYEQVRSIVAALTGDIAGSLEVRLVLPETGVCSAGGGESETVAAACCGAPLVQADAASGCCGGPAPQGVSACCVKDADAKAAGEDGCGCGQAFQAESDLEVLALSAR